MNRRFADYHRSLLAGDAAGPGRGLQRFALHLASFPYGWAVALRNRAYEGKYLATHDAGVPVVSVGNLTVGGTGKTPMVEYLARWFHERQVNVTILSRGYGKPTHRRNFSQFNDEALVLRDNIPEIHHLQGADRVALAKTAVAQNQARLLILDDAFQHRRLARNLDVVLLDATNPWGHDHLLPRGLLREPKDSLSRAHLVVITRRDQVGPLELERLRKEIARRAPDAGIVETVHQPIDLINADQETAGFQPLLSKPAVAFCGLGNPHSFRQTLEGLGARLLDFRPYADHHDYTPDDLRDLQKWAHARPPGCVVLTSQKDLVKLQRSQLGGRDLWAVRIKLDVVSGRDELERRLWPLAARAGAGQEAPAA